MTAIRLDLARIWTDASAILRSNVDTITAVAGMFMLLPGILSSWFLPDRVAPRPTAPLKDILDANSAYMTEHGPVILASALCTAFGTLALLALLAHPSRPTVAGALRIGIMALPFYMLASLMQTLVVLGGLFLFVVPGLYLIGRFICVAPVAAVEERRSPFAIMMRSFMLTRGNGWRIVLLLFVILMVSVVVSVAASLIFGIAAMLLPPDLGRLVNIVIGSLIETGLAVSIMIVSAAVYRQITGPRPFSV